jgi:ketosteroid isomerase-like protein
MPALSDLVHEVFGSLDRNERDHVRDLIAPDCDFTGPGMEGGRDVGLGFMNVFMDAFPGIQHHVRSVIESGDQVTTELEVVGTHTAPLYGPGGAIPATGKEVTIKSCNVWTVRDGIIQSYHVYFDSASVMAQLGPM